MAAIYDDWCKLCVRSESCSIGASLSVWMLGVECHSAHTGVVLRPIVVVYLFAALMSSCYPMTFNISNFIFCMWISLALEGEML